MKITQTAIVIATTVSTANAISLRGLFKKQHQQQHTAADIVDDNSDEAWGAADTAIVHDKDPRPRALQYNLYPGTNCQILEGQSGPPPAKWHPNYGAGWTEGHCTLKTDCNSFGYDSELECCNGAYSGQSSGSCLQSLPNPPTTAPTESGDLDVYYPDYGTAWSEGACINTRPLPSGRPNYSTLSECCTEAYRGQVSNACVKTLPDYESPVPTVSPTTDTLNGDDYGGDWYPDYSKVWTEGECINTFPPGHRPGDRLHYATELECCEGVYGGQTSGVCKKDLPDQPTSAPTTEEYDMWYPDYDTAWSDAGCSNVRPLPFTVGSRPVYDTQLECCKMSYGGQTSNACINGLPEPPTSSPTESGGLDVYYPDYDGGDWGTGTCVNTRPLPSGRVTYDSQLLCCEGAYAAQSSEACLQDIPGYASPTSAPSVDVLPETTYYVETWGWPSSTCSNARPLPHEGTPLFDTKEECCEQSSSTEGTSGCVLNSESKVTAPPSKTPSSSPTVGPSTSPTKEPTSSPSQSPLNPTEVPTGSPTMEPSSSPTVGPSTSPTKEPTSSPSQSPLNPTEVPTSSPTTEPSKNPSRAPSGSPTGPLSGGPGVYEQSFVAGQTASAAVKLAWDNYLASLTGTTYTQVTISGSLDPTGVTCKNPSRVNQLANALNTNAAVSVQCNSRSWNVGTCGSGLEFNSNPLGDTTFCSCPNPGYVVRPPNAASNWGGAGTATCGAPSQTIRVEFS